MGLTYNRETANNLAVKCKDWQILTIRSRKKKLAVIISIYPESSFTHLKMNNFIWSKDLNLG